MPSAAPTHLDYFYELRSDYNAARTTRFRRRRSGYAPQGSGADYHLRNEQDLLRILETARDIDNNDQVVGQGVSRVTGAIVQGGFTYDPDTGDAEIDRDLSARWTEWSESPEACDLAGERDFGELTHDVLRHTIVDGDIFGILTQSGQIEMLEAHRCRTPTWSKRRGNSNGIANGVEQDRFRRRLRYYFTREDIDPHQPVKLNQLTPVRARDEGGNRRVVQVYLPKRVSQSRGLSAMVPIVDPASQHDDVAFAKLVQQQITSSWAILRERPLSIKPTKPSKIGQQDELSFADAKGGWQQVVERIYPGMMYDGAPGETLKGFSPNIPNPEFFPHMRLVLTYIAINLELPLIVFLLDASETNFSGWRGALDMAKMRWRIIQSRLCGRWCRPVVRHQIRRWMREDRILDRAGTREGINLLAHTWQAPTWPYIQPLQDASADLLQQRNALNSPRRIQAARGRTWEQIAVEIVEDNAYAIELALDRRRAILQRFGEEAADLHWRELISLPTPDGVRVTLQAVSDSSERLSAGSERSGQESNQEQEAAT